MQKQRYVGLRKSGYTLNLEIIFILLAIIILLVSVFIALGNRSEVHETYTKTQTTIRSSSIVEEEYKVERTYRASAAALIKPEKILEIQETAVTATEEDQEEPEAIKHFPESTYVKSAIMLTGEAGGVESMTEQSGCLWTAVNRVMSDDPFYPDDLEDVIEQEWQFDGYTPDGVYTEECYNLAVDVLERWYREMNGEENVGRTLPSDYLFFTGDGEHNYFTKVQNGIPYVWGSLLVSPYKN